MSRCISSHGEYSEHTFPHPKAAARGEDRFTCTLCGDFDESAAMGALRTAEAIAEAAREWRDALDPSVSVADFVAAGKALIAAVDAEREAQPSAHPNPQT